jgi:hypothetical protein
MRLPFSSRTTKRGATLTEVLVVSAITVITLSSLASIMSFAGQVEQVTEMHSDTNRHASMAMQHVLQDVREAKEVEVLAEHRFRIYYPIIRSDGHYDRFRTDYTVYVEYAQTDAAGQPNPEGGYLWRRTQADTGEAVARNVKLMRVTPNSDNSIRISLHVEKTARRSRSETRLDERVIYMRNQ